MHHDVRTVKRRTVRIVVEERAARCENIPRIVNVKVKHAEPKREMYPRYRFRVNLGCDELTLREDLSVIFEFFDSVRRLGWINLPTYVDDRLVVRAFQETNAIVSWEHKGHLSPISPVINRHTFDLLTQMPIQVPDEGFQNLPLVVRHLRSDFSDQEATW